MPPRRRARAEALYSEGNRLFTEEKYSQALKKYEQAVGLWDHPAIHYNIVECLMNLGQNLEAHRHLKSAMHFGAAPLGKHIHRQAKTYLNILERTLARVRLVCREPGASVTLNGKPLFVGPGEATQLLDPGRHAVAATKPGFIPLTQQPNLAPGKLTEITLRLIPRRSELVFKRRWERRWVPWTVLGAGVALAATALPLYLAARQDFDDHKAEFDSLCRTKTAGGCIPSNLTDAELQSWTQLERLESRARGKYRAAIVLLGVGAAVSAVGVVLVVMNLPRAVEKQSAVASWIRDGTVWRF